VQKLTADSELGGFSCPMIELIFGFARSDRSYLLQTVTAAGVPLLCCGAALYLLHLATKLLKPTPRGRRPIPSEWGDLIYGIR
jgi:hypothetical protein